MLVNNSFVLEIYVFMILKQIEDAGFAKGNQYVGATHIISGDVMASVLVIFRLCQLVQMPNDVGFLHLHLWIDVA